MAGVCFPLRYFKMKWEIVKNTVAREVFTMIQNGGCAPLILLDLVASDFEAAKGCHSHEISTKYAEQAYDKVMNWDIRCAGKLRELFPEYFPPSLRKGQLVCYVADNPNSDWGVEIKN